LPEEGDVLVLVGLGEMLEVQDCQARMEYIAVYLVSKAEEEHKYQEVQGVYQEGL
jgi:hypothetical protein